MTTTRTIPASLVDRRAFLQTSAVAAAGLATSSLWARAAQGERMSVLKVGLIGCGGRGTGAAQQAVFADPGAVLWSCGDVFADQVDSSIRNLSAIVSERDEDEEGGENSAGLRWTDKVDVPESRRYTGFDAYKRVIDECDVVILTTPPAFRPIHYAYAVDKGVHVFCEKPIAVDGPGVRKFLDAARIAQQKKLNLMGGFCWRHQAPVVEAFDRILDGAIGDVLTVWSTYNSTDWVQPKQRDSAWTDMEYQARNWHYYIPMSGDHIVEQAVHAIDWIIWAKNGQAPVRCVAAGGRSARPDVAATGNVWDNFTVEYEYADGSRGYHMCRHWPGSATANDAYFIGRSGTCRMNPWNAQQISMQSGDKVWTPSSGSVNMYQVEHDKLFAAIRDGRVINDGEQLGHTTLMGIMGREAAYTGKAISWDEIMNSSKSYNAGVVWAPGERKVDPVPRPGQTSFA